MMPIVYFPSIEDAEGAEQAADGWRFFLSVGQE